jgi:uncharacterized RDD family membrane protein YckC
LRQFSQKAEPAPDWKQEVNRRVAQHRGRKGSATLGEGTPTESQADGILSVNAAAAMAAARVAARYAKAPSYSEMLAEEIRAAKAGPIGVPQSPAVAEFVAPGPEAAVQAEMQNEPSVLTFASNHQLEATPAAEPVFNVAAAEESVAGSTPAQRFAIRWDADMPVRGHGAAVGRASRGEGIYEVDAETVLHHGREGREALYPAGLEVVEAAQPIHANLIHFPKELVALRKARPRRAESAFETSVEAQLSIFEAEPSSFSYEVAAGGGGVTTVTPHLPWAGPEWSSIQLKPEARQEIAKETAKHGGGSAVVGRAKPALAMQVAPMGRRLLAAVVDISLITGAFLTAAITAVLNATVLPSLKEMELGSMVALALIGLFYYVFFFSLSMATPGTRYAGLELCTFSGKRPRLAQRCVRAAALVISLLPMGLGAIWALFDDQQLCWHDRLSSTYMRRP